MDPLRELPLVASGELDLPLSALPLCVALASAYGFGGVLLLLEFVGRVSCRTTSAPPEELLDSMVRAISFAV